MILLYKKCIFCALRQSYEYEILVPNKAVGEPQIKFVLKQAFGSGVSSSAEKG